MALASVTAIAVTVPLVGNAAEVYGKVIVALENIDQETNTDDFWQVASYDSRFGVKGKLATDIEGVEAIYNLEWAVDVTDQSNTASNHITARNQFIGLKGGFGEIVAGRNDTPLKRAQGKVDLFNDRDADIKFLMAGGEVRSNNTFQYTSPKLGDAFSISIMGRPGEQSTPEGTPPPLPDINNGIADATSMSLTYSKGSLYFALAMDSDIDGVDVDTTRLVGQWTNDNFGIGLLQQTAEFGGMDDEEILFVSAYYNISDTVKLKVQNGTVDNYGSLTGADGDTAAFGVDFALGKKTILGLLVASREGGDGLFAVGPSGPEALSRDTLGVNLEHNFD